MAKVMIYVCLLFLLYSCNSNPISETINKWKMKEIIFPKNLVFTKYARDTVDFQIPKTNYKIISYIDSLDCSRCKMALSEWNYTIKLIKKITGEDIPRILIINSTNIKDIRFLLISEKFETPICIDTENSFYRVNQLPNNPIFHSILINSKNRVLFMGNPQYCPDFFNYYINSILKENSNINK